MCRTSRADVCEVATDMWAVGHRRTIAHLEDAVGMLDDLRDMTQPPEMLNATSEEVEEISQCVDDVIAEVRAALTLLEPKQSSSARFSKKFTRDFEDWVACMP